MTMLFAQSAAEQSEHLTFWLMLFTVLLVMFIVAVIFATDKLKSCFVLFLCMLALGYRTIHPTQFLSIHPAEICVWLCFVWCLLGNAFKGFKLTELVPTWLLLMAPFWFLGFVHGSTKVTAWDNQLSEMRIFLLL